MTPRANWKGFIKLGELTIPIALYTATSSSERIAFHTLNRATNHRVHREFVDEDTGALIAAADQVKGYEIAKGEYVMLEPEEVAGAVPESDKILSIDAFIPCSDIDDLHLDRPYYLAPPGRAGREAFELLHEGLFKAKVAALARTVLFRRFRTMLIRADGPGLTASTLRFDYELRAPGEAFADIPKIKIKKEMIELAEHIIETKRGTFDPHAIVDRYEAAVADLVRAKIEGRPIAVNKSRSPAKVIDLREALRQSAGEQGRGGGRQTRGKGRTAGASQRPKKTATKRNARSTASHRRKAG